GISEPHMRRAELIDEGGLEYAGVGDHLLTGFRGHPIARPADCRLRLRFCSPTETSVPVRFRALHEINTLAELILVNDSRKRVLAVTIEVSCADVGKGDKLEQLLRRRSDSVARDDVALEGKRGDRT